LLLLICRDCRESEKSRESRCEDYAKLCKVRRPLSPSTHCPSLKPSLKPITANSSPRPVQLSYYTQPPTSFYPQSKASICYNITIPRRQRLARLVRLSRTGLCPSKTKGPHRQWYRFTGVGRSGESIYDLTTAPTTAKTNAKTNEIAPLRHMKELDEKKLLKVISALTVTQCQ
jgi:hypothetical protein